MKDKKTLISIIVLLVIFLPLAIYGTINHMQNANVTIDDNPDKAFIHNNKVYNYENGVLNATYTCTGVCEAVTSEIKDTTYGINYYRRGEAPDPTMLTNGFAVFKENNQGVLYSFPLEKKIITFDSIKTYNIEHTNPIMIMTSNGKSGVTSLETMELIIPLEYDFIGIPNRVTSGVLDTSRFIAKNASLWYVLENDGSYNHEPFRETIIDFNNNYVIVENMSQYKIYDYTPERNQYLKDQIFKGVYCIGDFVITISESNELKLYVDVEQEPIESKVLTEYSEIDFELMENKIDIYLDNELKESIVLS